MRAAEMAAAPAHQDNTEVHFKIKRSMQLRMLMDACCSLIELQASRVRFTVNNGTSIMPDDTAEKLGLPLLWISE